jgi:hypothetical protein
MMTPEITAPKPRNPSHPQALVCPFLPRPVPSRHGCETAETASRFGGGFDDLRRGELDVALEGGERVAAVDLDLGANLRVQRHPVAGQLHGLDGGAGRGGDNGGVRCHDERAKGDAASSGGMQLWQSAAAAVFLLASLLTWT